MIYAEARAKGDEMADGAQKDGKGVEDQVFLLPQTCSHCNHGHGQMISLISTDIYDMIRLIIIVQIFTYYILWRRYKNMTTTMCSMKFVISSFQGSAEASEMSDAARASDFIWFHRSFNAFVRSVSGLQVQVGIGAADLKKADGADVASPACDICLHLPPTLRWSKCHSAVTLWLCSGARAWSTDPLSSNEALRVTLSIYSIYIWFHGVASQTCCRRDKFFVSWRYMLLDFMSKTRCCERCNPREI